MDLDRYSIDPFKYVVCFYLLYLYHLKTEAFLQQIIPPKFTSLTLLSALMMKNVNKQEVADAERALREKAREESEKKKEKDKADRIAQKQKATERKETEKKRTQKGERRTR